MLDRIATVMRVTHAGREINVPVVRGVGLVHRQVMEPHLGTSLRASLALRSGTFVDVGAHLGETLIKVLVYGSGHAYLGFEPNMRAAAYVQTLLAANPIQPGRVVAAALSDRCGVAELRLRNGLDDSASIVEGFRPEGEYTVRQLTPTLKGDVAIDAVGPVSVLKIDVEGAELEVLRGCEQLIARERPVILCEILPLLDPSNELTRFRQDRADAVVEFVRRHGYVLLGIGPTGEVKVLDNVPALPWSPSAMRDYVLLPEAESQEYERLCAEIGNDSSGPER